MLSKQYKYIAAKYACNKDGCWLPLWMHHRDTAGVMKKLVDKWISDSIINASALERDVFTKLAVFLAAVHDCGKAVSYFQSVISGNNFEMRSRMNGCGLLVKDKSDYVNGGKTPHAYAGQYILQSGLAGLEFDASVASVIGAHHGRPMDEQGVYDGDLIETYPVNFFGAERDKEQRQRWNSVWKEIIEEAVSLSQMKNIIDLPKININAQVLLSGLLITADWLASNTEYFPLIPIDDEADEGVYPARIESGWRKCRFPDGWDSEVNLIDESTFEKRFHFWPNEIQAAVMETVNHCLEPGIFILEAQMGCGKTEAALSAAEVLANRTNCNGIFFALPTQATSNGIYHRLYHWAENVSEETRNAIQLAHSGAEFNEEFMEHMEAGRALVDDVDNVSSELAVHPWFQGNKRALLSNFVVGTVDQFLMGALKKKHFMLRHLGLAGKVIVIDECHAYDAYMNSYLDRMLEWMASYKIPVVLLSATLTAKRRKELITAYSKIKDETVWDEETGYPRLTWTDGKRVKNRIISQSGSGKCVSMRMMDIEKSLIKILNDKLADGGCACIIANTVKNAQRYYDRIRSEMDGVKVILYHAQYLMPDRARKEQELLANMGKNSSDSNRRRLILVGTQVLEQSLDYDADIMFTEICPIDLLLQRIGRLHRHDRRNAERGISRPERLAVPECYILMHETNEGNFKYDDGSKMIYGDYLLTRTKKILPDSLNIPQDIPKLVQAVYSEEDDLGLSEDAGYFEMQEEYFRRIGEKRGKAKTFLLKKPKRGMMGMLSNEDKSSDGGKEQVRDAGTAIEVILMRDASDGKVCFMNEELYGDERIRKDSVPDHELARRILRQRIKLPYIFSTAWTIEKTIDELEEFQRKTLAEWQRSPWLSGELIMLFDKNNETTLNGYKLYYDFSKGLIYEKQEDVNERERILPAG